MTGRVFWLILGGLLMIAAVSAVLGWLPCRADLSFILIILFTLSTGTLWFRRSSRWDRTNEPLISGLVHFSLFHSLVWITVLTPLVVLITQIDWLWVTGFGIALTICAELSAAWQLRFH
ncbi:hypothetical protein KKF05_03240 [Patescibacteria group bacterium]|nr:hypothetical protein [Patescibacteria group bacterium]MBU1028870.1 hypothetical protein [Patescibacteria group bacterium]MBU1915637.1 hypothetical protein [Patescibacteria group bacterium]